MALLERAATALARADFAVVRLRDGLLILAPYSWSGGGGPTGNRYIIGVYAAIFFLTPPMASSAPALLAWIGGALFTAKLLVNPFVAAKSPIWPRNADSRAAAGRNHDGQRPADRSGRGPRAHSWFNDVLLYFLDEHAYPPEVIDGAGHTGVWVAGDGRADIIMRSDWPIDHLQMTVESRVPTVFIVSAGAGQMRVPLTPDKPVTFDLPTSGVRDFTSYAYLLSRALDRGFTEHLRNPESKDYRNLGVLMRFTAVPAGK